MTSMAPDSDKNPIMPPANESPALLLEIADTDVRCWRLPGVVSGGRPSPLIIEIPPATKLPTHFCHEKGFETGYLLQGALIMTYRENEHVLETGDLIHISEGWPTAWENMGQTAARLLWLVSGQS